MKIMTFLKKSVFFIALLPVLSIYAADSSQIAYRGGGGEDRGGTEHQQGNYNENRGNENHNYNDTHHETPYQQGKQQGEVQGYSHGASNANRNNENNENYNNQPQYVAPSPYETPYQNMNIQFDNTFEQNESGF